MKVLELRALCRLWYLNLTGLTLVPLTDLYEAVCSLALAFGLGTRLGIFQQ